VAAVDARAGASLSKNTWMEGIDYLERLRDWKEMRELLEKANHHFGLDSIPMAKEFILTLMASASSSPEKTSSSFAQ
jgi:hypothetical protein